MRKPIAVLSADLHLARYAWARHPSLAGDAYYGFEQLTSYCIEHRLDLILAGDLLDKTRPDPTTVEHIRHNLNWLDHKGCDVFFIQGQHERDTTMPWFSAAHDTARHLHKHTTLLNTDPSKDIVVYGLDWTPSDAIEEELANIPSNTNILVAHQVWSDIMGEHIASGECSFVDVPHVQMVLTGDFHRHLNFMASNKDGKLMRILSPGSVCMQSINEEPVKRFFVLYDDLSVESHTLQSRLCRRFVIETKDQLEEFLESPTLYLEPQEGVPDNIAKNIVHITYNDDIPEIYSRLTNHIKDKAHLFLSPVRQQGTNRSIDVAERRRLVNNIEASLKLLVDVDTRLYSDLRSLLAERADVEPLDQLKKIEENFFQLLEQENDRR